MGVSFPERWDDSNSGLVAAARGYLKKRPVGYAFDAARAYMRLRDEAESAIHRGDAATALKLTGACLGEAADFVVRAADEMFEAQRMVQTAQRLLTAVERDRSRLEAERRRLRAERDSLAAEERRLAGMQAAAEVVSAVGPKKGRSRPPAPALPDLNADLRPDPASAKTAAEFMELLRQFRVWAGAPSFRDMSAATSPKYTASALNAAVRRDELPRQMAVVNAIVQGCGGSEEDRRMWATAWRRLAMNPESGVPLARVLRFPDSATGTGSP